jgi:hypothetical protein
MLAETTFGLWLRRPASIMQKSPVITILRRT